ncbi:MAG TPA: Clp protease N-terminal domain-containing protein [Blastocatellia bacterium]|nr:Clp protease N-terminal domain-containing protein [Blastocatellia bacterium]
MNTLEMYNQRFIGNGQRVFAHALNGARRRGQNYVVVEHFIEALITEEERFFRLLAGLLNIDLDQVQTLMARRLENFPQEGSGKLRLAPATIALLKQAWELARNDNRLKIESFDLIMALARDERGLLIELLKGLDADVEVAAETIRALDFCTQILSLNLGGKWAKRTVLKSGNLRFTGHSPSPGETTFIRKIRKTGAQPRTLE